MSDVTIYAHGPLTMSVCAPAGMTEAQVLAEVERQNPCGAFNGWVVSSDAWRNLGEKTGKVGPIPCNTFPETHTHWLITC